MSGCIPKRCMFDSFDMSKISLRELGVPCDKRPEVPAYRVPTWHAELSRAGLFLTHRAGISGLENGGKQNLILESWLRSLLKFL